MASLNKLNDIILKGECKNCKGKVARYLETGESKERFDAADHIRNIKKNYKRFRPEDSSHSFKRFRSLKT